MQVLCVERVLHEVPEYHFIPKLHTRRLQFDVTIGYLPNSIVSLFLLDASQHSLDFLNTVRWIASMDNSMTVWKDRA